MVKGKKRENKPLQTLKRIYKLGKHGSTLVKNEQKTVKLGKTGHP